jgi:hypothetical protein
MIADAGLVCALWIERKGTGILTRVSVGKQKLLAY